MDDIGRTTRNKEDASSGVDIFKKLNEEAMKPLHKECGSMTRMAFIIRVLHIKTYTCMTNKTFNMLCQLLNTSLPKVDFPKFYIDAKRALSDLGLGYRTIHVCKYDYILCWGDYANSTHCPHYGKSVETHQWEEKVPHKIVRYFPIIPRLQRFFFFEGNIRAHPVAQGKEGSRG